MKHYIPLLLIASMLTACGGEELATANDVPLESSAARIEIAGGSPSGSATRAEGEEEEGEETLTPQEPSRPGFCNADMLNIYEYQGSSITTIVPEVKYNQCYSTSVSHFAGEYNRDKWTQYSTSYDISTIADMRYGYAFPALAYSKSDAMENKERFNVNIGNSKITDLSLEYKFINDEDLTVPELFFGLLKFERVTKTGKGSNNSDMNLTGYNNGCYYFKHTVGNSSYTCPLEGKLYRIVSQLNLIISEINPKAVERIELYASNVPKTVTLCGNHGEYYPIALTSDIVVSTDVTKTNYKDISADKIGDSDVDADQYVRIASVNSEDIKEGVATLSSFFLPSMEGRSLCLRVYFAKGAYMKDGKEILMKDYPLQPAKSAYLTGADAIVYNVESPYLGADGKSIYVYNAVEDKFYSYANIRVNLSGKFENFFTEREGVYVTLEVCPAFEKTHYFDIQ